MKNKLLKVSPLTLGLLLCFGTGSAGASIIQIGDGSSGQYDCDIAIGDGANALGGHGASTPIAYYCATAVGQGAAATGANTSAYGNGAQATAPNATATGAGSRATGFFSTANGTNAQATANGSGAWGSDAIASHFNSVALGANTATTRISEVAVGYRQIGQVADGTLDQDAVNLRQLNAAIAGIVIPPGAANPYFKATGSEFPTGPEDAQINGNDSVAAGANARTNGAHTTAVGAGSNATAADGTAVGSGAQAGQQATSVGSSSNAGGLVSFAGGNQASASGDGGVALGFLTNATGTQAVSIGYMATATGEAALAFGSGSMGSGNLSAAIGPLSQATATQASALGFSSQANHDNSVALGSFTVTARANEVAVGYRQIGQVAAGTQFDDAVNVLQVRQVAAFFGAGTNFNGGIWTAPNFAFPDGSSFNNVYDALLYVNGRIGSGTGTGPVGPQGADGRSAYEVAVDNGFQGNETQWLESLNGADGQDGQDGAAGGTNSVKGGSNITVTDNADGTQTASLNDNIELSENGSVKVGATTVNKDGVSIEGGPSMTIKGINAGNQRVTNVANGRIERGSLDAVNGGQIWDMEQRWNDRWTNIDNRFERTNRRIDGLGAQMQAMANAAATPGEGGMTMGLGTSGGQTAAAIGWTRRLKNGVGVSAGASFGGGNRPAFGVGIRLGGH